MQFFEIKRSCIEILFNSYSLVVPELLSAGVALITDDANVDATAILTVVALPKTTKEKTGRETYPLILVPIGAREASPTQYIVVPSHSL